jgi:mannose-1-phosphate guanylyltransferase
VLVGGVGTRLRPLTNTTPKQMLPIVDVPMVERVLAHLAASGVTDAVLSLGYKPDAFIDAYPDGRCGGVGITYAVEPEPLDTAGGIAFAARAAGIDDTFVAVNGDVLTAFRVCDLVEFHRARHAAATIHLTPVADPSAFGVVPTDDDGRVLAFVEKPPPGEAPTNLINAGTYVLEPSVLDLVEPGVRVSMERQVFPALVAARSLYALASDDYWLDTGTPANYLQANLDLLAEAASVADSAHVEGEIVQPVFVGDGALVARGARVEGSVIGAGARIDADAQVVRSLVLPGAVVDEGAVVKRSIVSVEGAVIAA